MMLPLSKDAGRLHVRSLPIRYRDRAEAGRYLALKLALRVRPPLIVAALTPGAALVGLPIAIRFRAPLAGVETRPLTSPTGPAVPFGATDEEGRIVVDYGMLAWLRLSAAEIERAKNAAWEAVPRGRHGLPGLGRLLPAPTVVFVADALTESLEMEAAVAYARRHGGRKVFVAAPCAAPGASRGLRADLDGFVTLVPEERFVAPERHYREFPPVTEDDIHEHLVSYTTRWERSAPGRARG